MQPLNNQDYTLYLKKYLLDNYQLSEKDWDIIKEYAEPVNVHKNEYFVQKGKVCRRMGFIAKGVMRYCMERDGEDITCYFLSENNFAGDPDSFFSHKPSDKNAHALTDCVLISFSLDSIQKLSKTVPRFTEITALIDRKVMMDLMMQRDFLLHADAATKYQKFIEYYPHILQRVPLGYIASFLGIKQQSLSRLRKQIS
jgi:CRP-like cAMP-binding protein